MTKYLLAVFLLVGSLAFAQASPHGVDLSWQASIDPGVSYNVYRTQTSGTAYVKLNASPLTGLTFADNNVQVGQTYFYVVRAALNGLESANSNEAQARILPGPPTQVNASPR